MEPAPGTDRDRAGRRRASVWSRADLWAQAELFALSGLVLRLYLVEGGERPRLRPVALSAG
jgi:hypothetical protein